ncbi:hypothetical protein [Rubritalea tangerina]|uniref:hypothetical protein n=1 Tax=Rubritalea tangerina TaxID=430798 RepID=UPI003607A9D9
MPTSTLTAPSLHSISNSQSCSTKTIFKQVNARRCGQNGLPPAESRLCIWKGGFHDVEKHPRHGRQRSQIQKMPQPPKSLCRKATDSISPYLKTGGEALCPHRLGLVD